MATAGRRVPCEACAGQGGVYVMPNGDEYLNDEPGSTWVGCKACDASGFVDADDSE
jgi:hypothetical protein